jgi:oligoribonuclease
LECIDLKEIDVLGIFLDLETTGLNPVKHRAIDIALQIIDLYSGEKKASYESIIYQPQEIWAQSEPESLAINGFTRAKVTAGKSEPEIAQEIISIINNLSIKRGMAVFICQNPSFDRAFFSQLIDVDLQEEFKWPYHWLDFASMYWALNIKEMIEEEMLSLRSALSKDDIAKSYGLPPEEQPHRAMNGVSHLILCYKTVVGFPLLKDVPNTVRM